MSQTAEQLLIIYETEAEQWATYLHSVFTGPISEAGICCYDIATVTSRRDDFLRLAQYTCKLLILSKGMLEGLCQMRRFFLARVLSPAAHVVVLLCGVESLTPLLELVPLNGDECLQISSEQDAHEYLSTVTDIVKKDISHKPNRNFTMVLTEKPEDHPSQCDSSSGDHECVSASAANVNTLARKPSGSEQKAEQMQSPGVHEGRSSIAVVPSRVPCRSSTEVFILLKNEAAGSDAEIEFTGENQKLRVKPVRWNECILCLNAPDFPAGNVRLTVYSNGVPLSKAQLQYYTNMEEITCLLAEAADPVDFMCQALQEPTVEKLDVKLSSMLVKGMPTGGFRGLQCQNTPERELHRADVPSLLHFAAQYGFKSLSSLLLQCPGAERALQTANHNGQTPTEIAMSHGHTELHVLLKETLNVFDSGEDNGDASVYEMMCTAGTPSTTEAQKEEDGKDGDGEQEEEEEEDIYAPLGVNDEYDTILNSTKAVAIANRPPAPTPRPESTQLKEDKTPYIAKVSQLSAHWDLQSKKEIERTAELPASQPSPQKQRGNYRAAICNQSRPDRGQVSQMFQKKTPQGDADLYSLPTKQARGREGRISSTYDTLAPNQIHGLQQLIELQRRVKAGSLTVDGALERFSDWRRVQKGVDTVQQEKLSQLRASIINDREDDDSVYDKINIVHHTPSVTVNESRRGSQAAESDFYSRPLKGQHSNFFSKADKR